MDRIKKINIVRLANQRIENSTLMEHIKWIYTNHLTCFQQYLLKYLFSILSLDLPF